MKPRTTRSGASARASSLPRWTMCGRGIEKVAEMRMIEAVRAAITEEMERDERVLVRGEDVGRKGGVFGATDGLYARFGEPRVLDMPLAASGIGGMSIGWSPRTSPTATTWCRSGSRWCAAKVPG